MTQRTIATPTAVDTQQQWNIFFSDLWHSIDTSRQNKIERNKTATIKVIELNPCTWGMYYHRFCDAERVKYGSPVAL